MQQNLEKMGKQIFYKRLQQKMTQEELCQGICSVSYLSKIENGKIEASEEILQLLCTKLEIAVSDLRDIEAEVKEKLEEWLKALVHLDKYKVEELYRELEAEMQQIVDFEIVNYYKLLYIRYLIMKRNVPALKEELEKLKKVYKKYSPFQQLLYKYSQALCYCLQHKWQEGLQLLVQTELMAKEQDYYETGIYYNLALAYTHLEIPHMALHFANIAMEGFRNEYKFRNVINCQIIVALSYVEKGQYDEALKIYESILREADSFSEKDVLMAMVLSNIGNIHYRKKKYEEAKKYYTKSLQCQREEDVNYVSTVYEMALQCIHLEQLEEAKEWIDKGIISAKKDERCNTKLYLLLMLRYKYFTEPSVYKVFLETEAIPFFKSAGSKKELKKVYIELAEYFESSLQFKESNHYYKLAIEVLETILGG
ncbi:helix-turn-helix transcriptional regulator [Bacillus cereus group sp. BfR-BA-01380]|uniref:helix-turn-helix domain-containing protein n=1 Tax=Bacillus cereus group sp. BfR-BA-01380 TaxID=2920324 RepID=UPI001F582012|nr:helix-turn-helix transcriptional regulator [Bacillus cereus group sp. BfR-BA-01380]